LIKKLSPEEKIKIRVQKAWDVLAKHGIYTEEQLDEAIKKLPPINIGCMVSPIPEEAKRSLENCEPDETDKK